jgi:membrane protease YdiL (CAAX protease family)
MDAVGHGNPWIADVEAGRRRVPVWLTAPVAIVFVVGVLWVFGRILAPAIAASAGAAARGLGDPWADILGRSAPALVIFGALFAAAVIATTYEGRTLWRLRGRWPLALLAGLALGGGAFSAGLAIVWLAGGVAPAASPVQPSAAGALVLGAALVAFQASAEEIYFRGWLQPEFCADLGPWVGLTATALLFGGLHVISGAHGPLAVVNLCLGGFMFGLLALRSGGLVAPAAAHFGWNWTESGALGLTPEAGGSLASLRLSGDDLWSGGVDGMNGSLALTVVLAIVVAALILGGPRPRRPA